MVCPCKASRRCWTASGGPRSVSGANLYWLRDLRRVCRNRHGLGSCGFCVVLSMCSKGLPDLCFDVFSSLGCPLQMFGRCVLVVLEGGGGEL